jgi:Uma2 family endonuclease
VTIWDKSHHGWYNDWIMSTAPRYIPHYTLDDYQHWQGDWELIDGVPISMTPSPFGPHERIITEVSRQVANQFIENKCECRVYTNLDWIISDDTVIRPDLMVVCGDQPDRHLERPPCLMAEVLSDSTRGRDLTAKRTLCRENNVQHYLIIDPADQMTLHITADGDKTNDSNQTIDLTLTDGDCSVKIECGRFFD